DSTYLAQRFADLVLRVLPGRLGVASDPPGPEGPGNGPGWPGPGAAPLRGWPPPALYRPVRRLHRGPVSLWLGLGRWGVLDRNSHRRRRPRQACLGLDISARRAAGAGALPGGDDPVLGLLLRCRPGSLSHGAPTGSRPAGPGLARPGCAPEPVPRR